MTSVVSERQDSAGKNMKNAYLFINAAAQHQDFKGHLLFYFYFY